MPIKDPIKRKEYFKKRYLEKKEYCKKWYLENKEKVNAKNKKWYLENKEKRREKYVENSRMNYYKNRKKKINKVIAYQKIKNKTDINWILRKRLRSRLHKALKGITKSKKTMELLGIPHLDFLKAWLQSQFKEGMTWENRHLWHIDHIIPCSSFDLTKPEEQAKCFHYTNLQPLWASENLSKGNRIS